MTGLQQPSGNKYSSPSHIFWSTNWKGYQDTEANIPIKKISFEREASSLTDLESKTHAIVKSWQTY